MKKTTKITLKEALTIAKTMSAGEFDKLFESQIELLDTDNLFNPNDGMYNIIFHGKEKNGIMLFINGEYTI